jgi:hypothetical protein
MKELKLFNYFDAVKEEYYCIMKRGDIENYTLGSDFDIFCFNIQSFAKKIISASNTYIQSGCELKINDHDKNHWHVDLLENNKIIVRFDLYSALPKYKNINVKNALFSSIIENRHEEQIFLNDKFTKIYYPSLVDEIIIKYLEYIENYTLRPDKIKHLNYIIEKLEKDKDNKRFIDKLHYYTALPRDLTLKKKNDLLFLFKEIIQKIKVTPLNELPQKSIKFIKKKLLN